MRRDKFHAEELLTRFEDRREIQNLMGILSGYYLIKKEGDNFKDLWSAREDVSLGLNNGYYVGQTAVSEYYKVLGDMVVFKSGLIAQGLPREKTEHLTEAERKGMGLIDYRSLDTSVLEIAEDRQTAKGIWYCRGSYADVTTKGPVSYWLWQYYAVDFILEDNTWKIWHMLQVSDADTPCGRKWSAPAVDYPELEAFATAEDIQLPLPTVQCVVRECYSPLRKWTPSPRLPEEYDTFANTFSYGYEEKVRA